MEPYRRTPGRWANPKPSSTRPAPAPPAASPRPPFQLRGSRPLHQPHRRRWPSGRMQRRDGGSEKKDLGGVGVGGCGGGGQARGGLGVKPHRSLQFLVPFPFPRSFPPGPRVCHGGDVSLSSRLVAYLFRPCSLVVGKSILFCDALCEVFWDALCEEHD